jgi:hypothetical protein
LRSAFSRQLQNQYFQNLIEIGIEGRKLPRSFFGFLCINAADKNEQAKDESLC